MQLITLIGLLWSVTVGGTSLDDISEGFVRDIGSYLPVVSGYSQLRGVSRRIKQDLPLIKAHLLSCRLVAQALSTTNHVPDHILFHRCHAELTISGDTESAYRFARRHSLTWWESVGVGEMGWQGKLIKQAIIANNYDEVKFWLDSGVVRVYESSNFDFMHTALRTKSLPMIRLILRNGCQIDDRAVQFSRLQELEASLTLSGWLDAHNELHRSVLFEREDKIVKIMDDAPGIEWSQDNMHGNALHIAIKFDRMPSLKVIMSKQSTADWKRMLVPDRYGATPLHLCKTFECVKLLCSKGNCHKFINAFHRSSTGLTPLQMAMINSFYSKGAVIALLQHCAVQPQYTADHWNTLKQLVYEDLTQEVDIFLSRSEKTCAQLLLWAIDEVRNWNMIARNITDWKIVTLLLESQHGQYWLKNARDKNGLSVLMIAARNNQLSLDRWHALMGQGAWTTVKMRCNHGHSAADYARSPHPNFHRAPIDGEQVAQLLDTYSAKLAV